MFAATMKSEKKESVRLVHCRNRTKVKKDKEQHWKSHNSHKKIYIRANKKAFNLPRKTSAITREDLQRPSIQSDPNIVILGRHRRTTATRNNRNLDVVFTFVVLHIGHSAAFE